MRATYFVLPLICLLTLSPLYADGIDTIIVSPDSPDNAADVQVTATASFTVSPPVIPVTVLIEKGQRRRLFDCESNGRLIPLAILGSGELAAAMIDHTTVRLGSGDVPEIHESKGMKTRHAEDVDHDGYEDLVFHFDLASLKPDCSSDEVFLTGSTYDGRLFTSVITRDTMLTTAEEREDPRLSGSVPAASIIRGSYPNPFNPTTTISYGLSRGGHVRLAVYNVLGEEVAVLVDEYQEAGWKAVPFDGSRMPSGVYAYLLTTDAFVGSGRMLLIR